MRALLLTALVVAGCSSGGSSGPPRLAGLQLGVTFSPRGFTGTMTNGDITAFYRNHGETGRVVAFHMNWRDSVARAGEIPDTAVAAQLAARQYGFHLVVGFGFYSEQAGADLTSEGDPVDNTFANAETRAEFVAMVRDYCATYSPQWIFLGNEVNTYRLAVTAQAWADWIAAFGEAYDAIKVVSPDTIVFTTFQLERLKGLGAKNGWSDPPRWDLIADYGSRLDAVGFTSYPYFEYETPADVPAGYYTEIQTYWSGPVIFTEIGWLTDPAVPYTGSDQEQSDYVDRFFLLTGALDVRYVTWLFLHDFDAAPPAFRGIGLRTNDGIPRPAFTTWSGYRPG